MKKGYFLVLEGIDGSGKSTAIEKLKEYFESKNFDVIVTREPGGTKIGEEIRKILLDKKNKEMSSITEAILYAASRVQHVEEKIKPALQKGSVVICDRFFLSSLSYQGFGRNIGFEEVMDINKYAINEVYPDRIIFFDISPQICAKRNENKQADRLESEGIKFQQKIYEGYLKAIKKYPKNISTVDASLSEVEVYEKCLEIIKEDL